MKRLLATLLFLIPDVAWATCSSVPYTFTPNTLAQSGQVNANFAAVVACANNIDTGQILTGVLPTARGGTNNGTWTAGSIVFASATTQLGQDNTNLFWDSTNKRVGIGTNVPATSLDVSGTDNVDAVHVYDTAKTHFFLLKPETASGNGQIGYWGGSGFGTITLDGNIGIGVAPTVPLDVNGEIVSRNNGILSQGNSGGLSTLDRSTSGNALLYRNGGLNHLWDSTFGDTISFDGGGHVGIDRTPDATYQFAVAGSASISVHLLASDISMVNPNTSSGGAVCLANNIYISGNPGIVFCSSDERLKDIIGPLDTSLAAINSLNPVSFAWKKDVKDRPANDDALHSGFVAQQVMNTLPDCVNKNPDGYYGIEDRCLIAHMAKAIQEMSAKLVAHGIN